MEAELGGIVHVYMEATNDHGGNVIREKVSQECSSEVMGARQAVQDSNSEIQPGDSKEKQKQPQRFKTLRDVSVGKGCD